MSGKKIAYVELPAADEAMVTRLKEFYGLAAGWDFTDWGPTYSAFTSGVDGGINGEPSHRPAAPLVMLEVVDLAAAEQEVVAAGGVITLAPFEYPGGRRFHFKDPAGNELAMMESSELV